MHKWATWAISILSPLLPACLVALTTLAIVGSSAGCGRPSGMAPGTRAGETRVNPKDGQTYVWIPPGQFLMGCVPGDGNCLADEKPRHSVSLARGFWMGGTEVTLEAYRSLIPPDSGTLNINPTDKHYPIINKTWLEAGGYCRLVGGRLPTEAEWEYAARAGVVGAISGDLETMSWNKDNSVSSSEVGKKAPNAWGLYDMEGNVAEWCADWYDESYYEHSPSQNPLGASSGWADPGNAPFIERHHRVMRGADWRSTGSDEARLSARRHWGQDSIAYFLGLRCVLDPNVD